MIEGGCCQPVTLGNGNIIIFRWGRSSLKNRQRRADTRPALQIPGHSDARHVLSNIIVTIEAFAGDLKIGIVAAIRKADGSMSKGQTCFSLIGTHPIEDHLQSGRIDRTPQAIKDAKRIWLTVRERARD